MTYQTPNYQKRNRRYTWMTKATISWYTSKYFQRTKLLVSVQTRNILSLCEWVRIRVNSVRESKDKENKSSNILRMEWFSMNSIRIAVSKTWWNKIIGNNHKVKGRKDCFVSVWALKVNWKMDRINLFKVDSLWEISKLKKINRKMWIKIKKKIKLIYNAIRNNCLNIIKNNKKWLIR